MICSWLGAWAQNPSPPANPASPNAQDSDSPSRAKPVQTHRPNLEPPRSDRVNADTLEPGESSSKDNQIDLSPPEDDTKTHPRSSDVLEDAATSSGDAEVSEFHPWDPHKAAKDVEVGDFYFKQKNYKAAESRYREALYYKDNDAIATFRLAACLEKMDRPEEAQKVYENYLKILPDGPEAPRAKKAIERLKGPAANAKPTK